MTHLPFVAGAYGLGVGIPLAFALSAWTRLAVARRRLRAIDPREQA
ncbi:MAG: hypothetical protein JOZ05_06840 [Acetobacteraceae bacterium]|nr:hypothetical protein [Acetobacteraceae bacterium]